MVIPMVNPFKSNKKLEPVKIDFKIDPAADILKILKDTPEIFANFESSLTNKNREEVLAEIELGLELLDLSFEENFHNKVIVIIPPKYEFWTYLLLSIKFVFMGYKTYFLYHNWSKRIVQLMSKNLSYLKYQNLFFENAEDFAYDLKIDANTKILNFSQTVKGIKNNIPSFSTVVVDTSADLDYVAAYIFENAFAFAGMKSSNIKRILVDKKLQKQFQEMLANRIPTLDPVNTAKIRSKQVKKEIHELVSESIAEGAELLLGGDGFELDNYNNIVLDAVEPTLRIYQKKFFGPVMIVSYVDFEDPNYPKHILQQPSRGVVYFTKNESISFPEGIVAVKRPGITVTKYPFMERNPALEYLFTYLDLSL